MSVARLLAAVSLCGACGLLPSPCEAAPGSSSVPQSIQIKDIHFLARTYFFIHDRPVQLLAAEVWRNDRIEDNYPSYEFGAEVRLDPNSPPSVTNPQGFGLFHRLVPGTDYDFITPWQISGVPEELEIPVLRLEKPLGNEEVLAVVYEYRDEPGGIVKTVGSHDPAIAKVIHVPLESMAVDPETGIYDPEGLWYPTLPYELRNVYYLGEKNLPWERLRIQVRQEHPGAAADPNMHELNDFYIETLGLDERAEAPNSDVPDGLVDPEFLDLERGILFFPDLRPFDPDTITPPWCAGGSGGFLCLDNLLRNTFRRNSPYPSLEANPLVYSKRFPDPVGESHYYIEVTLLPPPPPGAVLHQNAPNPFNPQTTIRFDLNTAERAKVSVLDVHGRVVARILDATRPEGPNEVSWSGKDEAGRQVASGVYFYKLETPGTVATRKMVLAR